LRRGCRRLSRMLALWHRTRWASNPAAGAPRGARRGGWSWNDAGGREHATVRRGRVGSEHCSQAGPAGREIRFIARPFARGSVPYLRLQLPDAHDEVTLGRQRALRVRHGARVLGPALCDLRHRVRQLRCDGGFVLAPQRRHVGRQLRFSHAQLVHVHLPGGRRGGGGVVATAASSAVCLLPAVEAEGG
jgi:hypothetical protein